MPDLNAYLKHIKRGTDMVLETAATDPEISDADYDSLFKAVAAQSRRGKRGGLGPLARLRDREVAAKEVAIDV